VVEQSNIITPVWDIYQLKLFWQLFNYSLVCQILSLTAFLTFIIFRIAFSMTPNSLETALPDEEF